MLTDRELATVLAALRQFQAYEQGIDHVDVSDYFHEHEELSEQEIDELCYDLNGEFCQADQFTHFTVKADAPENRGRKQ